VENGKRMVKLKEIKGRMGIQWEENGKRVRGESAENGRTIGRDYENGWRIREEWKVNEKRMRGEWE
jgi:hypothetical protein